jgi:DNA repair exonuclease SbcCD nuclease subunit
MKFVHFADCHLDGYKEEKLNRLNKEHFKSVITFALEKRVDFVLLAGDLFNSALPRVDALKDAVEELKKLQDAAIPVYAIAGSHDFSPHGKTMFDVLEKAGLLVNVMKGSIDKQGKLQLQYTIDKKTRAHITGIIGKKGTLDKQLYDDLAPLRPVEGVFNIFLFHTSITELKPPELDVMESHSLTTLPPGFDYYAGGHVHITKEFSSDRYKHVVYAGPTFPNTFAELEKLKKGSFVYYNDEEFTDEKKYKHQYIEKKKVLTFFVDCATKTPLQIEEQVRSLTQDKDVHDAILLFRFEGKLSEGKVQDIDFKTLFQELYAKGAFIILKNTYNAASPVLDEVKVKEGTTEEITKESIKEFLDQIPLRKELSEEESINALLHELAVEQIDGEKKSDFVERVEQTAKHILEK